MVECSSPETRIIYPNLNVQQKFRLNKINEIKDYFVVEIKETELMSQRLSKYIASSEDFDKSLIVLSVAAATGNISIASYSTVIGAPGRIISVIFSLSFSHFKFLQES